MDELSRAADAMRVDEPLPADLEDLETDGLLDPDTVIAHVGTPEPAAINSPLDDYLDADVAADTGSTWQEVIAARDAARADARRPR